MYKQKLENEVRKKIEKKSYTCDDYMIEKLNLDSQTQDVYEEYNENVTLNEPESPKNNSPFWTTEQLKSLILVDNNNNNQDSTFSYNILTNIPNTNLNEKENTNIYDVSINLSVDENTLTENNTTSIQEQINKTLIDSLLQNKQNIINMRNLNLLSK